MKLSLTLPAGLIGLVLLVLAIRRASDPRDPSAPQDRRTLRVAMNLLTALVIALVFAAPWVSRNVIQSGYPLFPSGAMGVDVAWRVPPDRLSELQSAISEHVKFRLPLWLSQVVEKTPLAALAPLMKPSIDSEAELTATNWIVPWLFALPASGPLEVVIPVLLLLASFVALLRTRSFRATLALLGASLAMGVALWFLTSPDPRYVWASLWGLVGIAGAMGHGPGRPAVVWVRWTLLAVLLVCALVGVAHKALAMSMLYKVPVWQRLPVVLAGSDYGLHPRPAVDYELRTSRHGVDVFVPVQGAAVYSGPLPRVGWPVFDPDLAQFDPADLRRGFLIRRTPSEETAPSDR